MTASRIDFLAANHSGRSGRIAFRLSGNLTHMAVLASDTSSFCRAVTILIPDDLKFDAEVHGNLVTADAEFGLGHLRIREHAIMDAVPRDLLRWF